LCKGRRGNLPREEPRRKNGEGGSGECLRISTTKRKKKKLQTGLECREKVKESLCVVRWVYKIISPLGYAFGEEKTRGRLYGKEEAEKGLYVRAGMDKSIFLP